MPSAYNFKVNLQGFTQDAAAANTANVSERDAFAWMLHELKMQCEKNPFLKALPRRRMKDIIHKNKVRESY